MDNVEKFLCCYDPRNPDNARYPGFSEVKRDPCYCDNCFYGRTELAEEILRLKGLLEGPHLAAAKHTSTLLNIEAFREHTCWSCHHKISAGDFYAKVTLFPGHEFNCSPQLKTHNFCKNCMPGSVEEAP